MSDDDQSEKTEVEDMVFPPSSTDYDANLNELSDESLKEYLKSYEEGVSSLSKENKIYKSILKELNPTNGISGTEKPEIDELDTEEDYKILSYAKKCALAKRYLASLEKEFLNTNSNALLELKELKLQLDSLNLTLRNSQDDKDKFRSEVLRERHPVSKTVVLQKVAKFLDDSIKNKRAMSNRYKIQIEGLIMNCNKQMNQLKDQNKRLACIDHSKCQEMKYEHLKTCEELDQLKDRVVVCKTKHSSLAQKVMEIKKALEEEESELAEIQELLSKKKYMKNVMMSEQEWNEKRKQGLEEAIHKIKVDPRRHDLPQIFDYATVKRENADLKRCIKMWKKKVAIAEQAKLMHLNALQKKKESI